MHVSRGAQPHAWCATAARPSALHLAAAGGHLTVARLLRACASPPRPPTAGAGKAASKGDVAEDKHADGELQPRLQAVDLSASLAAAGTAAKQAIAREEDAGSRPSQDMVGSSAHASQRPPLDRGLDARKLSPLQIAVKGCHMRFAEESGAAACCCGLARQMAGWGPDSSFFISPSQRTQGDDRRQLIAVFREAAAAWARVLGRDIFHVIDPSDPSGA